MWQGIYPVDFIARRNGGVRPSMAGLDGEIDVWYNFYIKNQENVIFRFLDTFGVSNRTNVLAVAANGPLRQIMCKKNEN
jgi:hypothetical protein